MLMRHFDFVNDQITYLEYNISTSGLKPVPAATGQKQDSLSQGKQNICESEVFDIYRTWGTETGQTLTFL